MQKTNPRPLLVEVSFLIPLAEDINLGTGQCHPASRWNSFHDLLEVEFGGYSRSRGTIEGVYRDPDTGESISDESVEYRIALRPRDVARLRRLLEETAAPLFVQKEIYFNNGRGVEFLVNADR